MGKGLIAAAVAILVGLFVWAFWVEAPEPTLPPVASAPTSAGPEPSTPAPESSPRPPESIEPPEARRPPDPGEPTPAGDAPSEPRATADDSSHPPALRGLQTESVGVADLEAAGAPERFEGGIRVTRVHPDSSAAEVALEPGDIILRAQTTDVTSMEELSDMVDGRDYTRLTFIREGILAQVILKPPYEPPAEGSN